MLPTMWLLFYQRAEEHEGHRPGLQVVVRQAPDRLALAVQAFALELPGRAQAADHGARQEAPEAFAQARAGRVLGRGHALVVAAVVLDVEVAVAGGRQRELGQPAVERLLLVAQLVRGRDADAVEAAHAHDQADHFVPGEVVRGHQPGTTSPGTKWSA